MCDVSAIPGLAQLRALTDGDDEICVAVLDGPVDHDHPAFDGANFRRLAGPWPAGDLDGPSAAHGTVVASVLLGQRGSPVFGVAPGCRGLSVPVFSGQHPRTSQLDLARGIEFAAEAGAHVISISGGQLSASGEAEDALARAVRSCRDRNILVVAAAGNDGCFCAHVPAALPSVLAVGALDDDGAPMAMSNWGAAYQRQGILAPGANILGALPGGATARRSGTSLATPVVAGVAGLLLSLGLRDGRRPDPLAVGATLLSSADPCEFDDATICARFLTGKLNIERAVQAVSTGNSELAEIVEQSCDADGAEHPEQACSCLAAAEVPVVDPPHEPQLVGASTAPQVSTVPAPRLVTGSADDAATPFKQLMYAIGTIGYDFGSEARRDAFKQQMPRQPIPSGSLGTVTKATLLDATIREVTAKMENSKRVITGGTIEKGLIASGTLSDGTVIANVPITGGRITGGTQTDGETEGNILRHARIIDATLVDCQRTVEVAANPYDPVQMLKHLVNRPAEASALIWTLNLELTPVYALEPLGSYGSEVYYEFIWILACQQIAEIGRSRVEDILLSNQVFKARIAMLRGKDERPPRIERFAVPGTLGGGTTKLFSGQVVPEVTVGQPRGIVGWNIDKLTEDVVRLALDAKNAEVRKQNESLSRGAKPATELEALPDPDHQQIRERIRDFLNKIYYDMRNLGTTSHDRALNFGATNAFQAIEVLINAHTAKLALDAVTAEKSPYSRADGDCWDIKLRFFDPENTKRAKKVYRYSVDVSDVMPVTTGELRSWSEA